jgi:hypothetical protein
MNVNFFGRQKTFCKRKMEFKEEIPHKITGVCLVGTGNATHASVAVFSSRNIHTVNIFSLHGNEVKSSRR